MKKIRNYSIVFIILLLSFYYTNNIVSNMKNNDLLMIRIKEQKDKYSVNPIDAEIIDNTIIPGIK